MPVPLPFLNKSGVPTDGDIVPLPDFCRTVCDNHKCRGHYRTISGRIGLHKCPYGLYSAVLQGGGIVTGLLIKGKIDADVNNRLHSGRIQAFSIEKIRSLIATGNKLDLIESPIAPVSLPDPILPVATPRPEMERKPANLELSQPQRIGNNELAHDIRIANAKIKAAAEALKPHVSPGSAAEKLSNDIYFTAEIISSRLQLYEFASLPPGSIPQAAQLIGVHQSILKVHRILLREARDKSLSLELTGESFGKMYGYRYFDLVPFLLVQNAIKYAAEGKVEIGPCVSKDELVSIFEKGTRGTDARRHTTIGEGLGLNVVKQICDMHGIDIRAQSEQCRFKKDGISYSMFQITLEIPLAAPKKHT